MDSEFERKMRNPVAQEGLDQAQKKCGRNDRTLKQKYRENHVQCRKCGAWNRRNDRNIDASGLEIPGTEKSRRFCYKCGAQL